MIPAFVLCEASARGRGKVTRKMESSNTGSNRKPGTFQPGDPRINRKGRPKSFDALRVLAQQIGHEQAFDKTGAPVVIDGHLATRTETILREWADSSDPRLQMAFVEIAYGKVPTRTEITGENGAPVNTIIQIVRDSTPRE